MKEREEMSQTLEFYVRNMRSAISKIPIFDVIRAVDAIHEARMRGSKIFVCGNGGSAATASHFAADLAKNTRKAEWPHYKVIALTDSVPSITAYGNDCGYPEVFASQLEALVEDGDVVILISASGMSPNVLGANVIGRNYGATTIGLSGFAGGDLANETDIPIVVPNFSYEQIEDLHSMICHMLVVAAKEKTNSG